MSRHREIRNMDYSDDYDGYDDVYGHSVDDEYGISPGSLMQYIYNRDNDGQMRVEDFIQNESSVKTDTELVAKLSELPDLDKLRLESCLVHMRKTIGPTTMSTNEMVKIILHNNFDAEKSIDQLLNSLGPSSSNTPVESSNNEVKPSIKVVAATNTAAPVKTPTVIKGFELPISSKLMGSSTTPRSLSPYSGRSSPADENRLLKMKENRLDAEAHYRKERGGVKDHLYMVVVGHVDAGKSTLMGHLLCELGQVNHKVMHKYEQESRKLGKQSFMYAWVLDETGEERTRGITMDVGRYQFETNTKLITLLDAPGHKDFIPNMIAGAGQADVALLVVDATRGEFETGFNPGGQTREHTLLVRSLGVTQLAVAVNKLDMVGWCQQRFDEIVGKLKNFLKQAGYRDGDIVFVPCSGLTGQNLITPPTESALLSWYSGPPLLDVIDKLRSPERPVSKPFRLAVNDIFKETGGGFCVSGRVETGCVNIGERVMVCPNKDVVIVKGIIGVEDLNQNVAFAGDQATVTIAGIEMQNVSIGNILCDPQSPVQVATNFQARIVVFTIAIPITRGSSVILHHQSLVEPAVMTKLISQLNKSTGEVLKKKPRFLDSNTSAVVEIQVSRPIALELYSDCKELGRIMLRANGETIAAGLIIQIL